MAEGGPGILSRFRPKVPLHFKVMVSYLGVVGLVLLPTLVYLRTLVRGNLREATEVRLESELDALADRLGRVPEWELPSVIHLIIEAMPQRVTIVDPRGNVLGDSIEGQPLGSHADRPEIVQALAEGRGRAIRESDTTKSERIYVARRYPREGPLRGVVRLSVPSHDVDAPLEASFRFIKKAGALALTAAVILSFVAALVVSRPLRRLKEAIEAYSSGDFGHPVGVESSDELGEVADALRALAQGIRDRLVAAGEQQALLGHLIDELPVGIIVYDPRGTAVEINGRARELCRLPAHDEIERASSILKMPEQAMLLGAAESSAEGASGPLRLPWLGGRVAELEALWLAAPDGTGGSRAVLIITSRSLAVKVGALESHLMSSVNLLRDAAKAGRADPSFAARLERAADEGERLCMAAHQSGHPPETLEIGPLLGEVLEELSARATLRKLTFALELDEPSARVVEIEGRSRHALRALLDGMISEASPEVEVRLEGKVETAQVRITARAPQGRKVKTKAIAEMLASVGGDAGSKHTGDASEAWVKLPRG